MEKLSPGDIRVGDRYEEIRGEARRGVAELKRHRRVTLGDQLALVFENRETIRSALEELVRAEHVTDPDRLAGDVGAFNALIPPAGALGATLYLEIADPADLAVAASHLQGVEACVYLEVAGTTTKAQPEIVTAPDEAAPAYYLSFPLSAEQRHAWLSGAEVVAGVDHAACSVRVSLDEQQRRAIAADF
ncbi:MAG: DUF3501 family protein [Chloroflexi bacterium]|nr:MAG: DUF3501 family protein [Chloroflexota bacterium]